MADGGQVIIKSVTLKKRRNWGIPVALMKRIAVYSNNEMYHMLNEHQSLGKIFILEVMQHKCVPWIFKIDFWQQCYGL